MKKTLIYLYRVLVSIAVLAGLGLVGPKVIDIGTYYFSETVGDPIALNEMLEGISVMLSLPVVAITLQPGATPLDAPPKKTFRHPEGMGAFSCVGVRSEPLQGSPERVPAPGAVPLAGGPDAVGIHSGIPCTISHDSSSNSIVIHSFEFHLSSFESETVRHTPIPGCVPSFGKRKIRFSELRKRARVRG